MYGEKTKYYKFVSRFIKLCGKCKMFNRSNEMLATTAIILVIAAVTSCIRCAQCATVDINANRVIAKNSFSTDTDEALAQPSRLRELLVNDLGNIIVKSPPILDDCSAGADVKVDTINCQCNKYSCLSRRFASKRSRFLIARSCEDVCCRKRNVVKKSTLLDNYTNNLPQCEISTSNADDIEDTASNLRIKSMVQIYSSNSKKFLCLGSLVHSGAVLATYECVSTRTHDQLFVKMKETVDKFQSIYQVRNVTEIITPSDNRTNMALLILETEIDINNQIGMSCLSNHQESIETLSQRQCFITSLEYTNGRLIERTERAKLLDSDKCRELFNQPNRMQLYNPKQSICAGYSNGQHKKIKSNGASLVCIHQEDNEHSDQYSHYILYGLLTRASGLSSIDRVNSPHLFTNIYNSRHWLEKILSKHFHS